MLFADVAALLQVILIDLALAGDNAVAVGLAASGLPEAQRKRAIFWGIVLALLLRVVFALITVQLLAVKGILLAGGLLLLWVAWRMYEDLKAHRPVEVGVPEAGADFASDVTGADKKPTTFGRALFTIVIADVSMSLDNVLAVAGVSRHNEVIMAFGLVLAVALMGVAASVIAKVIEKFRWIAILGIVVIVFAAVRMIWEDAHVFLPDMIPAMPSWLGGHSAGQ